ncbi:ABC transporter ATP-binding protein [Mycobacteroides abscessus subsp. abscessus]|nr:ABC transporter ATP-binding protein [Mycobacteroides abscessus subsp. abscessus]
MYLGQMMELGETKDLYNTLDPDIKKERIILQGDVPDPSNPPSGCPFRLRCPKAHARCAEEKPSFLEVEKNHWVACHLYDE